MRGIALILAILLPALTLADRLILIPTARKVPIGVARLEHLFDQSDSGRSRTGIAFGVNEAIDAEIVWERGERRNDVLTLDVAFNVVPALIGISPGISVGIRDAAGETRDGRSLYVATTYQIGLSGRYNGDVPLEVTHGYRLGDRDGYFIGVMIPFRESFRLLAEHDGRRINAGLEFRPLRNLWVRSIHRSKQSFWSVTLAHRF